jgi:FAD/FMN-containing dehydrogenase
MSNDLTALRAALEGDAVAPDDPGWDAARLPWNLVNDQQPALVVWAQTPDDVVHTLAHARANGLRVAVQGTGHGSSTLGDLTDTVLLRTGRMAAVTVDPEARTARVEAGAPWSAVLPVVTPHGLTALHGSSATVGAAGYTLGGGLGWLARAYGMSANHVRALDVVTADGRVLRVDAEHEPDLFWALRGGGGAHAVVVALELELVPLTEVYGGTLSWPVADAAVVVEAYRRWTETVPDTLTSVFKLSRYPPLPELPEPLRGQTLAQLTFVFDGPPAEGEALVQPMRDAAPPTIDTVGTVPAADLGQLAGDPPGPLPGVGDGLLLEALTPEAAAAYVEVAGPDVQIPLINLQLRHLGGALVVPPPGAGAASHVRGDFLLYGVGMAATPEMAGAVRATLDGIAERMRPYCAGGPPLTFAERQPGSRASFDGATADRLAAVKATYDPEGLLVGNHAVD